MSSSSAPCSLASALGERTTKLITPMPTTVSRICSTTALRGCWRKGKVPVLLLSVQSHLIVQGKSTFLGGTEGRQVLQQSGMQ